MCRLSTFMRKHFLFLILIMVSYTSPAQQLISGIVRDSKTGNPLPFANIITNTKKGTITDMEGKFEFPLSDKITAFTVSYVGYESRLTMLSSNIGFYTIALHESYEKLQEVTLLGGKNPALGIIKKAIENRDKNNPEKKLSSYRFKAYNKMVVTANPDSINGKIDSIYRRKNGKLDLLEIDSSNYELKKQLNRAHLYLTEKISDYTFTKEKGRRETILATRMAGFKEPIYEFLMLQIQSFSFYKNTYTLFGTKYTNPIAGNALRKYNYRILDTVTINSTPAYMIHYFPKKKGKAANLEGVLYIDMKSYALQKAIAQLKAVVDVKATQDFKYFKNQDLWFPISREIQIKKGESNDPASFFGGAISVQSGNSVKDSTIMRTNEQDASNMIRLIARERNFEISLNAPLSFKGKGLAVEIDDQAHSRDSVFWNTYRTDSLSRRGKETYFYVDSLVTKENIENKFNSARKLLQGYIPTKYVDIDARNIIKYNNHEGFRLGAGFITNANFSPKYRFNAYGVYGTRDGQFKFGLGAKARLNKSTTTWVGMHYTDDLVETGSAPFITDSRSFSLFEPRLFNITLFHKTKALGAFFEHDITAKTHAKIELKTSSIAPTFNYQYTDGVNVLSSFHLTTAALGISWTPFNEYLLTRHGKSVSHKGYPQFSLQAIQSFQKVLDGDFSFTKFHLRAQHQMSPIHGKSLTSFLITAGVALGDIPITHLYHASPNQPFGDAILRRFSIAGRDSFETMFFNEFFSDRLVTFQVKHKLDPFKISRKFRPELILISRYALGTISHPERHQGITFNSLEKGYSESGFELNKLLKGFGLSAMYRHGAYHLPRFDDNISFKFTFYFSLGF